MRSRRDGLPVGVRVVFEPDSQGRLRVMTCPSHVFPWPLSQIIDNVVPEVLNVGVQSDVYVVWEAVVLGGPATLAGTVRDRWFERAVGRDWCMCFGPRRRD